MTGATDRAVLLDRGGEFRVVERPIPRPGPAEVLVRVRACGVCGSDRRLVERARGGGPSECGLHLGHEVAGEVVQAGAEVVADLPPGSRVTSVPARVGPQGLRWFGASSVEPAGFAEHLVLSGPLSVRLPDHVGWDAIALVEPLAVALHALDRATPPPGAATAVLGAGPLGLMVVATLSSWGRGPIVVADPSAERRRLATAFGATNVVDPGEVSLTDAWNQLGPGLSPDGGIDAHLPDWPGHQRPVLYECAGVDGLLTSLLPALPRSCRVVALGGSFGPELFVPWDLMENQTTVEYVVVYTRAQFRRAAELVALDPARYAAMVTRWCPLDEVGDAFDRLQEPSAEGKVLVTP